jgi:hypothetical protein
VKLAVPLAVGVPEITPALEKVSPAGRLPADTDQVYPGVPPEAARDALYAVPFVPADNAAVVIASVEGAVIVIDSVAIALTAGDSLSDTSMVNVAVPPAVGFPEMTPPFESVSPAGRLPAATDHVYPGVPPVAAIAALYAVPLWPAAKAPVVMFSVDGAVTVIDSAALAVCDGDSLSETATVKVEAPLPVGVPETIPVLESARPAGRLPEASFHVYAGVPPFALRLLL